MVTVCVVVAALTTHAGLTMNKLGKDYARNVSSTPIYAEEAYMGNGVMSIRNNLDPQWKDQGYYQRNRDCGQTFTATKDGVLDAVVMRTSNSTKAVFANAIGQPMFLQLFEIAGTPVINDNGTPYGSEPEHGFGVGQGMHRCDDFIEGITFTSLGVAHGGGVPDVPPTYPNGDEGKLVYVRCDLTGEHEIELQSGHRYAFVLGFTNPTDFGPLYEDQCRIGISMENYAAAIEPADLTVDLTPYQGGHSIRREGDGTLPPVMKPGDTPHPELLDQSIFPDGDARYDVTPTSDGYPDVDTYRDWNFYLEVKDNTSDVHILDGWTAGTSHVSVPGSDRALVALVCAESNSVPSLSGVTYGGQAMTEVVSEVIEDGNTVEYAAAYVLNDAGIANASDSGISLEWSTAPSKTPTMLSCMYENVDQSSLAGAYQAASSTSSPIETGNLTNAAGDMLVAFIVNGDSQSGFAFDGDFSELIEENGEGANCAVAHKIGRGTADNAKVSITNGNRSALVGFVLRKNGRTRRSYNRGTDLSPGSRLRARVLPEKLVVRNAPRGPVQVTVHALSGQQVGSVETLSRGGTIEVPIAERRPSTGLYIVRIRPVSRPGTDARQADPGDAADRGATGGWSIAACLTE